MAKFVSGNDYDDDNDEDVVLDQERDWEEKYYSAFNDCVGMTKYLQSHWNLLKKKTLH